MPRLLRGQGVQYPQDPPLKRCSKRWSRFRKWLTHNWLYRQFAQNLALRTSALLSLLGVVVVAMIFAIVSVNLKNDVFQQRVSQIEQDAAVRFSIAQSTFSQAAVSTVDQAQQVAGSVISEARTSAQGARGVGVILLRAPSDQGPLAINEVMVMDDFSPDVITPELRTEVQKSAGKKQFWQSVTLADSNGGTSPGIVVGKTLNLPLVHQYEMYVVYSLAGEQATVSSLLRSVLAGSIGLLIFLGVLIWMVTYRLLGPVQRTALAAKRLAEGEFDVRVEVQGEDELAVLGSSFNEMAQSLQTTIDEYDELAKLQQRFVSDVSHELRTPLTTIKMAGDMIYDSREDFDLPAKRSAELLHDQVERFETMLADLLEISRYDAQAQLPEFEFIDLVELCEQVISDAEPISKRLKVPVILRGPQLPVRAEADEKRIERIIRNLVLNAVEHAEGNPVIVSIGETDNAVSVRVRDYGVGMTPEVAAQVFNRFYRADPARARTTGGTGLGLSIAKEDARLHGGILEAQGEPGMGSAFMLTIPRLHGNQLQERALTLWEEGPIVPKMAAWSARPAAVPTQFNAENWTETAVRASTNEALRVETEPVENRKELGDA
ncbi:MtrAB system histidine kinase MtrB [Boudabousia liubingyangii]|uniref:MtrAB system histidine kinase MtrB n=1 Tax=Boudabousia liubingyangii TaxID=1921764 RepID=UPI0009F95BDA|nr:MtrAB system histidine kinase MtrB [Boudabousia liubingyangii]